MLHGIFLSLLAEWIVVSLCGGCRLVASTTNLVGSFCVLFEYFFSLSFPCNFYQIRIRKYFVGSVYIMLFFNSYLKQCDSFNTFQHICIYYHKGKSIFLSTYGGYSKWIAHFYLETLNFKLAQKCSFHALEVLPVARNAKFQPMYSLLEGVTVRWFGHSNKVLMNGRSKCLSGLVFPPSKEWFQFRKQKEITWGKVWGIRGV